MTNLFGNAKPKLLGEDTHAASLTGSSDSDIDNSIEGDFGTGPTDFDSNVFRFPVAIGLAASVTINVTSTTSKILISAIMAFGNNVGSSKNVEFELRRGATVLDTINQSMGANSTHCILRQFTDTGQLGNVTYSIVVTDNNSLQIVATRGLQIQAIEVKVVDTHAASLTGDNTQTTHESEVLP